MGGLNVAEMGKERLHKAAHSLGPIQIGGNLPDDYTPVTIYNDDYPELVSKETPVNTVELGTVLVAISPA